MLDEAIEYMKSLQLQIQVLATGISYRRSKARDLYKVIQMLCMLSVDVDGAGNDSDDDTGNAALHVAHGNGNRATNASGNSKPNASIKITAR